jgi:hypothetical protein
LSSGKFKVHGSPFSIAGFVFNSNVGHGDPENVTLRNDVFAIDESAVFAYLCEVAIEILLEFVVEDDTKVSASVTFDLYSLLPTQPVEVGVVMGFAWFGKVVINSWPLTSVLRVGEKAMAVLGEFEQLAKTGFLARNRFEFNRALTNGVFHVGFHTIVVTAIGKFRYIFSGYGTEPRLHSGRSWSFSSTNSVVPRSRFPLQRAVRDAERRTEEPGIALLAGVRGENSPHLLGNIELGKSKNHFFTMG